MEKPAPQKADSHRSESADMQTKQISALVALYKVTAQQQKLLEEILVQQKAQTEWLISIGENVFPEPERFPGRQSVKVNDFNMPFMALVGFLVKFALASIPAAIIIYAVMIVIAAGSFALLSGLLGVGGVLSGL